MKTSWQTHWLNLTHSLEAEDDHMTILKKVIDWCLNLNTWISKVNNAAYDESFQKYRLNDFTKLNLQEYDFGVDWEDPKDILTAFKRREPSNFDSMLMKVRDILHELIVYKTTISCPRCDRDDLRCYMSDSKLVLECDNCGYLVDKDLKPINHKITVRPCKRKELMEHNLLRE
jgi:hypothetical protein